MRIRGWKKITDTRRVVRYASKHDILFAGKLHYKQQWYAPSIGYAKTKEKIIRKLISYMKRHPRG